jgi:hypothetical protein
MRTTAAVMVVLSLVSIAPACGDDKTGAQMCKEVGELCHDTPSQLGVECHELGHDGAPEQCEAMYDDCIAECSGG